MTFRMRAACQLRAKCIPLNGGQQPGASRRRGHANGRSVNLCSSAAPTAQI
jgi:hypothetical protein